MDTSNHNTRPLSVMEKMAMAAGTAVAITGTASTDASIVDVDNNPRYQSA